MSDIKRYDGGVRAWRIWHLHNGKLYAIVQDKVWKRGENLADNYESAGGFYGFKNIEEAERQESGCWDAFQKGKILQYRNDLRYLDPTGFVSTSHGRGVPVKVVIGSFIGYGRVKVGTKGCRSQFAIPEYILTPGDMDYALELVGVAENYGMTIVTRDQANELKTGLVPYERLG